MAVHLTDLEPADGQQRAEEGPALSGDVSLRTAVAVSSEEPLQRVPEAAVVRDGARTQFESTHRKACVQTLLDSSNAVHSKTDHKAFKQAVNEELTGNGTPR